jgi:hypothetical protein
MAGSDARKPSEDAKRAALAALRAAELSEHVEILVAEEHRLWHAAELDYLDEPGRRLLEVIRDELDRSWDAIRRRRANPTGEIYPAEVPEPPNEFEGPDPEPPHLERGGVRSAEEPAPDPGINPHIP